MNCKSKVFILIIITTALRLLFAHSTELGPDEVYYYTYAQKLAWCYFDHPPLIALLIRLTTLNLLIHSELAVRIGAIICSGICTWLIFSLASLICSERAGWFASLLYSSSVYCSIIAGAFILPDSPQLVFWFAAIILLVKISRIEPEDSNAAKLWILFGLTGGLCIMCKVHGIFLWVAAILYIIFIDRKWLRFKGTYIALVVTLILISPIFIWNIQYNFVSYTYHAGRVMPVLSAFDPGIFVRKVFQQIMDSNPVNFLLICYALWLGFNRKLPVENKEFKILLLFALPLIATITVISIFRETLSHWTGPAYSSLLILPAVILAASGRIKTQNFPLVVILALSYLVLVSTIQVFATNYFPGTLSKQKQGQKMGMKDVTLDMYGWNEIGLKFDSLYKKDITNQIMPANSRVIISDWSTGAATEFYVTYRTNQEVYGIGNLSDLHQYYISNPGKRPLTAGENAYYIAISNDFSYRASNNVLNSFKDYEVPLVLAQARSGLVCRFITVYRLLGYKAAK